MDLTLPPAFPVSPPRRISRYIGISPRKGILRRSASKRPPPCPNISTRSPLGAVYKSCSDDAQDRHINLFKHDNSFAHDAQRSLLRRRDDHAPVQRHRLAEGKLGVARARGKSTIK